MTIRHQSTFVRHPFHPFVDMQRKQNVVVNLTSTGIDAVGDRTAEEALKAVIEQPHLQLVGLCVSLGSDVTDSARVGAGVDRMIALMEQVHRDYDLILTELVLEEEQDRSSGPGTGLLHQDELVTAINEALDDACARYRYPRPSITIMTHPTVIARDAAG
ncbi:decarboxylase [Rhodococcus daqingensis]|uniref:Decarboxylase n=1 Tax=Rhodococcus daqingensis TaxID=2479363 RepID=A0ABW2S3G7_9NOCA